MKFLPISQMLKMMGENIITQYVYFGDYPELRGLQKQIGAYRQSPVKVKTKILPTVDGETVKNFMLVEVVE